MAATLLLVYGSLHRLNYVIGYNDSFRKEELAGGGSSHNDAFLLSASGLIVLSIATFTCTIKASHFQLSLLCCFLLQRPQDEVCSV